MREVDPGVPGVIWHDTEPLSPVAVDNQPLNVGLSQ
jgi:hypothetical protein